MGPNIFANPLVGTFALFMLAVVIILFFSKLMPLLMKKRDTLWAIDIIKFIIIFTPIVFAFASLFDFVSFDLFKWINFVIMSLSVLYIIELFIKQMFMKQKGVGT